MRHIRSIGIASCNKKEVLYFRYKLWIRPYRMGEIFRQLLAKCLKDTIKGNLPDPFGVDQQASGLLYQ